MKLIDPYLLGPDFDNNGKGPITTLNLLLHNGKEKNLVLASKNIFLKLDFLVILILDIVF